MARQTDRSGFSCSFCGARSPRKLIAGPAIFICNDCVASSAEMLGMGNTVVPPTTGLTETPGSRSEGTLIRLFQKPKRPNAPTCNFCGRSTPNLVQPPSKLGTRAHICGECVGLCQQIIAEHLGSQV